MKILSSIRFWNVLMSSITLCLALFLIGEYNKSQAASNDSTFPYRILYIKQNHVPLMHANTTQKEKIVLKGMVITDATSHKQFQTIANQIKEQYAHAKLDSIELTIHNKNNGQYDDLAYEPLSKGNIIIAYTALAKSEHSMYTTIQIQLNKHP